VQVGGDFYDFFSTDAGWTVILGDVAGKGVDAAAMAALVRHGARFLSRAERGPAAILAGLDEALRDRRMLSLCSALCVRLHAGQVLISSAGHPAPLIIRRDGRIREIGGSGPILGVMPSAAWPERTVRVDPDETILLYTDGVTDTRGASERFGLSRLRALLVEHADHAPADLLGEIELALERFQLGPQSDDTAALALRLQPTPATAAAPARPHRPRVAAAHGGSAPGLRIATTLRHGRRTIEARGDIDHVSSGQLLEAFAKAAGGPGSELVLDLARVTFVDSVGLRTVIEIEKRARDREVSLRFVPPPEHVRAVFRLSGSDSPLRLTQPSTQGSPDADYADRVELDLKAGERAPLQARGEVREAVEGKLPPSESAIAVLLASELVTNAVMHPRHPRSDRIRLRISSDSGRARVEVADSGTGFDPAALKRDDNALGGLGLQLVDRGAVRWGISRGDRFCVWFELSQEPPRDHVPAAAARVHADVHRDGPVL
jgi:anti-anti-sigma factor